MIYRAQGVPTSFGKKNLRRKIVKMTIFFSKLVGTPGTKKLDF